MSFVPSARRIVPAVALVAAAVPLAAACTHRTPPALDPDARAVIDQLVAAQKALKSYEANVDLTVEQNGKIAQALHSSVAYQRPNRARVVTIDPAAKTTESQVSDGTAIYMSSSAEAGTYGRMGAFFGRKNIAVTLGGGKAFDLPVFGLIISDPKAAATLVDDAAKITRLPDDTIGGVAADVVQVKFSKAHSPTVTFSAGKSDHLLRRVSLEVTQPDEKTKVETTSTVTETLTAVQADPALPASLFVFKPAPGQKEQAQPAYYDARLKPGAAPLPFTATDTTGKPVLLDQYKGRVVLLDFWATWCGPCREEMPNLVAAYQKFHAKGFEVIGVSGDQPDDGPKLAAFAKANGMTWRQVHDTRSGDKAIAVKYAVDAIPQTILIGRDGKIFAVGATGDDLDETITAALAAK